MLFRSPPPAPPPPPRLLLNKYFQVRPCYRQSNRNNNEFRVLIKISRKHPSVPSIIDYASSLPGLPADVDTWYFVNHHPVTLREYLTKWPSFVASSGTASINLRKIPIFAFCSILRDVASALAHCLLHDIVHLNVTPDTVCIANISSEKEFPRAVVTEFWHAIVIDEYPSMLPEVAIKRHLAPELVDFKPPPPLDRKSTRLNSSH